MSTTSPATFRVSYLARYADPKARGKDPRDLIRMCAGEVEDPITILASQAVREVLQHEMIDAGAKSPVLALIERIPLPVMPSSYLPEQGDSA